MKTLSELKAKKFRGIDVNLKSSLTEYNLAVAKISGTNEYEVIYEVANGLYDTTKGTERDLIAPFYENWFNQDQFLQSVGMDREEWISGSLANMLHDMVCYYGYENIFGSSYHPFQIDFEK